MKFVGSLGLLCIHECSISPESLRLADVLTTDVLALVVVFLFFGRDRRLGSLAGAQGRVFVCEDESFTEMMDSYKGKLELEFQRFGAENKDSKGALMAVILEYLNIVGVVRRVQMVKWGKLRMLLRRKTVSRNVCNPESAL